MSARSRYSRKMKIAARSLKTLNTIEDTMDFHGQPLLNPLPYFAGSTIFHFYGHQNTKFRISHSQPAQYTTRGGLYQVLCWNWNSSAPRACHVPHVYSS